MTFLFLTYCLFLWLKHYKQNKGELWGNRTFVEKLCTHKKKFPKERTKFFDSIYIFEQGNICTCFYHLCWSPFTSPLLPSLLLPSLLPPSLLLPSLLSYFLTLFTRLTFMMCKFGSKFHLQRAPKKVMLNSINICNICICKYIKKCSEDRKALSDLTFLPDN